MTEYTHSWRELRIELLRVLRLVREHLASQRLRGVALSADEASMAEGMVADSEAELRAELDAPINIFAEASAQRESPLQRARRVFRMADPEFNLLILALSVETDARILNIVCSLSGNAVRRRPTLGIVRWFSDGIENAVALRERPCFSLGLLLLEGEGPLPTREVRVANEFLARLTGSPLASFFPSPLSPRRHPCPALEDLAIGAEQHQSLCLWAKHLPTRAALRPLLLSGAKGSGRATVAHAAARSVGYDLIEGTWDPSRPERIALAAREALWHDAALLVRFEEAATDASLRALWAALSLWKLPVALAVTHESLETVSGSAPLEPVIVRLENPSIAQREKLWDQLLARSLPDSERFVSTRERYELAGRFDLLPGSMGLAMRRALAEHTDAVPLHFEALAQACRAIGSASMSDISQRLVQPYTRRDLVLSKELDAELSLACAWIDNRRQVFEEWGFERRVSLGRGLTALFTGPPGTGKTMAAQVLARELALELFRVDLSRVMSKFIGETEKNLSSLFNDAKASGAILFFDEADSLFGKRSEVKDAHDRYANLEISYLLQRMEEHTGTTILATNRRGDLDEAFTRRFHFILDFPMPGANERQRIWEGMIPSQAVTDEGIDFQLLARDYEVSGGEIRNAVLTAAFLAAQQRVPISQGHLKRGLLRELLKTGRVLDVTQRRALGQD